MLSEATIRTFDRVNQPTDTRAPDPEAFSHVGVDRAETGYATSPCGNPECDRAQHFYVAIGLITDDGARHTFVLDDHTTAQLTADLAMAMHKVTYMEVDG
jgi:hypothetical protein